MKIKELSKGMAQKVQFIGAILHEPSILILDEPFSGLDPVNQDVFSEEIRNLARIGVAVLLSAHQMNLVENLCDRIFMIHKGKKIMIEQPVVPPAIDIYIVDEIGIYEPLSQKITGIDNLVLKKHAGHNWAIFYFRRYTPGWVLQWKMFRMREISRG
jgi:energy-coupling factor transporter ATP-binding protein EcfA2